MAGRNRARNSGLVKPTPAKVEDPRTFSMTNDFAPVPTSALVASSVRYSGKTARIYAGPVAWQREAYRHYGICGEARYAANFFANTMSRATLFASRPQPDGGFTEQGVEQSQAELSRIFGPDTTPGMLAAIGLHLTIAGECYLVGRDYRVTDFDPDSESTTNGEVWEVVSVLEMQVQGDEWAINYGNGQPPVVLPDEAIVIRIWRPSPERRIDADSPFRSLIPVLAEIERLTLNIWAQIQNNLKSAGILFMPEEMAFPPPPEGTKGTPNSATAFMLNLAESMLAVTNDPGNPASLVPTVVTAPGEFIDKAKLMSFWTELDDASMDMRSQAVRRFAQGMDLPVEQVLGMSSNNGTGGGNSNGISHWGQWQIDESTTKQHIEPMLALVCQAVTVSYLRLATGNNDVVRFDTTKLRTRPDRSKEVLELWDRGLIKGQIAVEENGFAKEDMPDDDERKMWLLVKIASGSATPDQVAAALAALGVTGIPDGTHNRPRESRPTPSLDGHEQRREPEQPRALPAPQAASVLLAACEPLVYRGLERAGNRLRSASKGGAPTGVPAYATHQFVAAKDPAYLLEDAWSVAPQVLEGIADPAEVVPLLDSYCRSLFNTQEPHTRDRLRKWLEAAS